MTKWESDWHYANAAGCRTGIMICSECGERIGVHDGEYRYKETNDKFINQHRKCSHQDIEWSRLDAKRLKEEVEKIQMNEEIEALKKKWGEKLDLCGWCERDCW